MSHIIIRNDEHANTVKGGRNSYFKCGSRMGMTTQNLYRLQIDTSVRFSAIKGEEHIADIYPLLPIEDALRVEYFMKGSEEEWH
jgi:hypothetical protein